VNSLRDDIKTEALNLGFSFFKITIPCPSKDIEVYEKWLAKGHHASMAYLASEHHLKLRKNPENILSNARSVLVLGVRYPSPKDSIGADSSFPEGRTSSYAWGKDYHIWIASRLARLGEVITKLTGKPVQSLGGTDSIPVLERSLGTQAGLGWIGKNSCLIVPKHGSFFFLAELFLDLELDPDPHFLGDFCGKCQACLDSCPTQCIQNDRTIDANRCISYLTIENKGEIPTELRPKLGNWVFGCDICQVVCPWNRFAVQGSPPTDIAWEPLRIDLLNEMQISPQIFSAQFFESPIKRSRRRGYLRNIAVALGNAADERAVFPLTRVMKAEEEPLVRAHAAWALGQIGTKAAMRALTHLLCHEKDENVTREIQQALSKGS
jgi:epoxyqueuosine reductase